MAQESKQKEYDKQGGSRKEQEADQGGHGRMQGLWFKRAWADTERGNKFDKEQEKWTKLISECFVA